MRLKGVFLEPAEDEEETRHGRQDDDLRHRAGDRGVALDRQRRALRHVADPAEKAELWPRIVADHAHYAGYQAKTERDIPVVVLEP